MGTRSDIIVKRSDGTWKRIYCHWDGYLDHNGRALQAHYTTQKKCEALVALGDLSSLGETIGRKHPFDSSDPKYDKMCKAYGRDRGETNVDGVVGGTLQKVWPADSGTEFTYVWDGRSWWVGDPDVGPSSLIPLDKAIAGELTITPNVKAFGANIVIGKHKPQPRAG